ncbi:MAG: PIN domain-containing protein [Candidatus Aenigmarchaeota archaeon]|nr:PIN domain-containing protein [Candidatus Aenigmarchaeota archaeon]
MACLDTTFLIDLLSGKEEISLLMEELDKTEVSIAIASPSVMEIWLGAMLLGKESEKVKINELLSSFEIFPLDEKSAKEAAEIEADLWNSGKMIDIEDVMIAGIARIHGEKVVTRDQHFAQISGLKVLKY